MSSPTSSTAAARAPSVRLLSILVPIYNEARTVPQLLDRLLSVPFPVAREIILLDDGSSDGTREWLASHPHPPEVRVVLHPANLGKAAAIRSAMAEARGDVYVIQDADLEYDPRDLPGLLAPILRDEVDIVYGSRFLGEAKGMAGLHALGNRFLTWLTNRLFHVHMTDMETCYKMARASVYRSFTIQSERFELEPEITGHMLRSGARWIEMPISFDGRDHSAGKKISWTDGLSAVRVLLQQRFGAEWLQRRAEFAAAVWLLLLLVAYVPVAAGHAHVVARILHWLGAAR